MKSFSIRENSLIARLAAKKLRTKRAALVLGSVIYLYGVTKKDFMTRTRWLRHELKHVEQYQRLGIPGFIISYLWQCAAKGYYNAPLEVEARRAEDDEGILSRFTLK